MNTTKPCDPDIHTRVTPTPTPFSHQSTGEPGLYTLVTPTIGLPQSAQQHE